jgi:hypothetical protein
LISWNHDQADRSSDGEESHGGDDGESHLDPVGEPDTKNEHHDLYGPGGNFWMMERIRVLPASAQIDSRKRMALKPDDFKNRLVPFG